MSGLSDIRKLLKVCRQTADKLGVDIAEFDVRMLDDQVGEEIQIMFVVRAESIETVTEKSTRQSNAEFDALIGGQDFSDLDTEEVEAKRLREERKEKIAKSAETMAQEMLDGEEDQ